MLGRCREGNLERSKRLHTIKHNVFCMEVHFLLIELSSLFAHFIVPIKKLYAPLGNCVCDISFLHGYLCYYNKSTYKTNNIFPNREV